MGDHETASALDSTTGGDASAYTSQSTVAPLLNNKGSSKKNVFVAVGVGLLIVGVLIVAVLLFTGSSASGERVIGKDDEDSDGSNQPQSYVVNTDSAQTKTTNVTKTKRMTEEPTSKETKGMTEEPTAEGNKS
ncbi:uncharacterized protein [Dermacentor andersoni]|uniref:uncharacterized protein n=1 Tax=Dermacentor andersoni TaxID=34620 RepID=UPI003B3A3E90